MSSTFGVITPGSKVRVVLNVSHLPKRVSEVKLMDLKTEYTGVVESFQWNNKTSSLTYDVLVVGYDSGVVEIRTLRVPASFVLLSSEV